MPTPELNALIDAIQTLRDLVGISDDDAGPLGRIDAARTTLARQRVHLAAEALALTETDQLGALRDHGVLSRCTAS